MAVVTGVRPGQFWADADPRSAGRTLRVDWVTGDGVICTIITNTTVAQEQIDSWLRKHPSGSPKCPRAQDRRGKTTRIALARFRPTSTGYRLIHDAPDEAAACAQTEER